MKTLILLIALAGCTSQRIASNDLPPRKQKQKIAVLQKKLDVAKGEIAKLHQEMELAKIALVRRQVSEYEKKMQNQPRPNEPSTLFQKERELLYEMIHNGDSNTINEAELLLDRILRIITELSNDV